MTRLQLEHIIRAAAANADLRDIVVVGSQAILGTYPEAPAELTQSLDADVFPKDAPERSILIDGSIGELSLFHETFGYYAHGVDETTAVLPDGWKQRLVKVETADSAWAVGWCLEPHDLAVSKLVAGREKDLAFLRTMVRAGLVSADVIQERLATTRLRPEVRQLAEARLSNLHAQ
jgi:hypothetical protein